MHVNPILGGGHPTKILKASHKMFVNLVIYNRVILEKFRLLLEQATTNKTNVIFSSRNFIHLHIECLMRLHVLNTLYLPHFFVNCVQV